MIRNHRVFARKVPLFKGTVVKENKSYGCNHHEEQSQSMQRSQ